MWPTSSGWFALEQARTRQVIQTGAPASTHTTTNTPHQLPGRPGMLIRFSRFRKERWEHVLIRQLWWGKVGGGVLRRRTSRLSVQKQGAPMTWDWSRKCGGSRKFPSVSADLFSRSSNRGTNKLNARRWSSWDRGNCGAKKKEEVKSVTSSVAMEHYLGREYICKTRQHWPHNHVVHCSQPTEDQTCKGGQAVRPHSVHWLHPHRPAGGHASEAAP